MKTVNNSLMRIIFAMIIGLVLVVWPDAAANYMAITIGILFIIPGIISTRITSYNVCYTKLLRSIQILTITCCILCNKNNFLNIIFSKPFFV